MNSTAGISLNGSLLNISSATSTFTGGIETGGLASSNGLAITGGALRLNAESFTDLTGTGLLNTAGALTLDNTGDWTGTIDSNNFAGGAIGAGDLLYGAGVGSITELLIGASSTILTTNGSIPAWSAGIKLDKIDITGSGTSTVLTGALGSAGLSSSNGLTISGGAIRIGGDSITDFVGTNLSIDASGVLNASAGSAASVGGTGAVQFANSSAGLNGSSKNLVWSDTLGQLKINDTLPASAHLTVIGTSTNIFGALGNFVSSGSTSALTVFNTGFVSLGATNTPRALLSISASSSQLSPIFLISTTTALGATSTALMIDSQGRVTIGATSSISDYQLSVQGSINVGGHGLGNNASSTITGGLVTDRIRMKDIDCSTQTNGGALTTDAQGNVICTADDSAGGAVTANAGTTNRLAFYSGATTIDSFNSIAIDSNARTAIGTSTPYAVLSIWGTSTPSTPNAFQIVSSASSTILTVTNSGRVGIGTTTPGTIFSVKGSSLHFDSTLINLSTSSANIFTVNYLSKATTTIPDNTKGVWTIATTTGTGATPIISITTATGQKATTSIVGGFVIDGGAFSYDHATGTVSIDALNTGPMAFDTDAGILSWIDMPTATTTANIVNSYSAQIGSTPVLTIYGTTTTSGNILYGSVGIGTTTPFRRLTVASKDIGAFNGAICADNGGLVKCYGALTAGTVYGDASSFVASDVAENYPIADSSVEEGDIVMVAPSLSDGESKKRDDDRRKLEGIYKNETPTALLDSFQSSIARADKENAEKIIGIVSTQPGVLLGDTTGFILDSQFKPVALSGRVPLKVSTEAGTINAGDKITIGSIPGVGVKAIGSEVTVGIALESFDGSSATTTAVIGDTGFKTGKILVFVNLGYSRLDSAVSALASLGGMPTNAWAVDQQSGKVNVSFFGNINMQGNSILDVGKISGMYGKWSIDENGKLVVRDIETETLKVKNAAEFGLPERPIGITIYDEITKQPFCIKVRNSALINEAGACTAQQAPSDVVSSPTSAPQPVSESTATSTPSADILPISAPPSEPVASSTPPTDIIPLETNQESTTTPQNI